MQNGELRSRRPFTGQKARSDNEHADRLKRRKEQKGRKALTNEEWGEREKAWSATPTWHEAKRALVEEVTDSQRRMAVVGESKISRTGKPKG